MGLTVVPHPDVHGKAAMLETLDNLRAKVESGEVVAMAAVGISQSDDVASWMSTVGHVSRLRVYGAVSHLLHCLHAGEV